MVKDGGIFSYNYVLYKVSVDVSESLVQRKDADFYVLRKILLRQYPHLIIPPLLPKTSKQTPKQIKKREKYYTRFMQGIFRSEVLKSCSFLEVFLTENDTKKFQ